MGWTNYTLTFLLFTPILSACAGLEGAVSHPWDVTAQNGDKMVGCLAEDVSPDLVGYYDLEKFPDFSIETFQSLVVDYEKHKRTGKPRILLARMQGSGVKSYPDPEKLRRKCNLYPLPEDLRKRDYLLGPVAAGGTTIIQYRLYEKEGKMVFVDVYTKSISKG